MQPLSAPRRYADQPAVAPVRKDPVRKDPAPSRAAYRMQRLWLTPVFRAVMRVGLPAFAVTFVAGIYLADADRRAALTNDFVEVREAVEQRPEFQVSLMEVEGASPSLDAAIRTVIGVKLPQSSFDLDLDAARARVVTLDAVADAELRVKSGGVLQVTITERVPAMVWRKPDALELLDATGRRVAMVLARSDRSDLPLLVGEGANKAVPEAMQIIAAAGPLLPRVRGLVRMGMRRWDIVLDRDQRILLPAEDPVRALERIIALDQAEDLLARDITAIDLRNRDRPVLRLSRYALRELRRAKGLETVENDL